MASSEAADMDLQCFQKRINLGSVGQGLNAFDFYGQKCRPGPYYGQQHYCCNLS